MRSDLVRHFLFSLELSFAFKLAFEFSLTKSGTGRLAEDGPEWAANRCTNDGRCDLRNLL
ncbi:MAG: hypothetical protein WAN65_10590 [Candidatus Sulfotelmatobacter sp.]